MKQIINISSNGIKQAIDDLVNENELLQDKIYKQEEENKKLNNIINELEKMMKNDLEWACSMNENGLFNGAINILEVYLDKLQELKGSDKE